MVQKNSKSVVKYRRIRQSVTLLLLCILCTVALSACSQKAAPTGTLDIVKSDNNTADRKLASTVTPTMTPSEQRTPVTGVTPSGNTAPAAQPEGQKDAAPTVKPTVIPAATPTATPSPKPTVKPSPAPQPTTGPIAIILPEPKTTPKPKATPTPKPTPASKPTSVPKPTVTPTPEPTEVPTPKPEAEQTISYDNSVISPPPRNNDNTEEYAKQIIKLIIKDDMSDAAKVKAVHDYIVRNTAYDETDINNLPASSFTAEGVLFDGKAVCQGYAETFQLFMNLLGIDSKLVAGTDLNTGIGHAWDMVKLNGNWYNIDTTWDDPIPDQGDNIQYKYFLVTDAVLSKDHDWNRSDYPACDSTDYQYYAYEKYMVSSVNDYESKFMDQYNAGESTITVLYPEKQMPDINFLWGKVDTISYYPPWRLGDYTVLTIMLN